MALSQSAPLTGPDVVQELADDVRRTLSADDRIQLIVYPEIHLCGDADLAADANDWLVAAAEPLDGPRVQALAAIAAEHRVWLVPGSVPELGADGRVYNTAVVLDPSGRLVSSYRKIFPWRPYEGWATGTEFVVFDVPEVGRVGLSICYDSWFPESTRQLGWLGAEVVLNLVKTVGDDRAQELVLARANAIVNQVYFLSLNAAGPVGAGHSIYVDPNGDVITHVDQVGPSLTVLDLDLDQVSRIREHGTAGLNRPWAQLRDDDPPIPLPAYGGAMTPGRWDPDRHRQPQGDHR